jgi:hypothetical protein
MLNGHDAIRFIWSHNRKRRQLTQGQFAMIGAMGAEVLTTAHLGGKGREGGIRAAARKASVGQATMAKAFLVRDYAGDLVASRQRERCGCECPGRVMSCTVGRL